MYRLNKNHLKHGIYEKILFEFLSQEEQELFLQQEIDEIEECKKMIRFCDLLILKFMRKIKELEEKLEEAEKEKEEAIKTEEFEKASEIKKQQTEIKKQLDEAKRTWERNNKQNEQTITREDIAEEIFGVVQKMELKKEVL